MSVSLLFALIIIVYIFDVFALIWISGRFVGIQPFPLSQVGVMGLAVLLFSWLSLSAFIQVPLILKPLILLISAVVTIYIFISLLETHILKSIAAGAFFVLCQLMIFIFLLKQLWNKDFFQIVKIFLFQQ